VGWIKVVGARDTVPSSSRDENFQKLVVTWGPPDSENVVSVRGETVARVRGELYHALVAK
jgi:hypothetical protein